MGVPRLDKKPTQMETQVETDLTQIGLGFLLEDWATVELNNKHLVFINSDAQKKHLEKIGKELASQPTWKDYNIHIAVSQSLTKESKQQSTRILGSPITESYQSWTWERGVGLTEACGSGACAVAAMALTSDFSDRLSWVVDIPGYADSQRIDQSPH